jgi:hypothetical protein
MRRLHQNARAIPGIRLATARAAVIQIDQRANGVANNGVRLPAFDVGNEAHTAGIVFELRVVKTLGFGCCLHITI